MLYHLIPVTRFLFCIYAVFLPAPVFMIYPSFSSPASAISMVEVLISGHFSSMSLLDSLFSVLSKSILILSGFDKFRFCKCSTLDENSL